MVEVAEKLQIVIHFPFKVRAFLGKSCSFVID